jgi:O-antigen biosynthesis protein
MLFPLKLIDLELAEPARPLGQMEGYFAVRALVRLRGRPIGWADAPIINGQCCPVRLRDRALRDLPHEIWRQLCIDGLAHPQRPARWTVEELLALPARPLPEGLPSLTIAVPTRDRAEDLARCLSALTALDYPGELELLVVENAPKTESSGKMIAAHFPRVRRVVEPRPGLNWARNRAIVEARGEILAFCDDDTVPDSGWARALGAAFAEEPTAAAVTGLVAPLELETKAQVLFERRGGFGRGFKRKWFQAAPNGKLTWHQLGTGNCGTGANMAFRRALFDRIGGFDPALDSGTPTRGSGDLEMFFRVLKSGHALLYEPAALVRHRHRRTMEELRQQLTDNGSVYAYIQRSARAYPDQRREFRSLGWRWFREDQLQRLKRAWFTPGDFPLDLAKAEIRGCLRGRKSYAASERQARQIEAEFGPLGPKGDHSGITEPPYGEGIAVVSVNLEQPPAPLTGLEGYYAVRAFAQRHGSAVGSAEIECRGSPVSSLRLAESLADAMALHLYKAGENLPESLRWAEVMSGLRACLLPAGSLKALPERLPNEVPVTIVVGTCDRPDDLRHCLKALTAQRTSRRLEIIVVDNRPGSGLTPAVVREFPGVRLVEEPRAGVAYARNAGVLAATGEIIATTDDDVTMPPDWIEKLVAPFARADVMAVSSNILPIELENRSQQWFERYGGLGRGFERQEVNGDWFTQSARHACPTWELGGTANSAFRASIFRDPAIGLMDEALGPGMPSGVGEDTYIFYRVLKAGYTQIYEPSAFVWHKHRKTMAALRKQLYNYSKGHVAYHLTTLFRDKDRRVLLNLLIHLPRYHWQRIKASLRGRSDYPLSLILLEIRGNLMGPWSLWQSVRRVRRQGRSSQSSQRQPKSEEADFTEVPLESSSR